jgi:hypothetical protein
MNNDTDDGSLAFLGIGKDPSNIQFHCEQEHCNYRRGKGKHARCLCNNPQTI